MYYVVLVVCIEKLHPVLLVYRSMQPVDASAEDASCMAGSINGSLRRIIWHPRKVAQTLGLFGAPTSNGVQRLRRLLLFVLDSF